LMILYDVSPSVSFGRKELLQANVAASLAYTAAVSNNGCGLIMFADRVIWYIPPRMGWSHFMEIITAIAQARPVDCKETNVSYALDKLVNELPESLTFILSDFLYPFESDYSFQRTTHGTSKHEVKAFQIIEEFEMTLPPNSKGLITLYDYESGQSVLVDVGKWATYNQEMQNRLEDIRHRLRRAGIDLLLLTPADDFRLKINAFMQRPM
jgi:uncharacterized protein (DUF58 family)